MRVIQIKVTKQPTVEPVTVEEFKTHARLQGITIQTDDAMLKRELTAARIRCERFTRRALLKQEITVLAGDTYGACCCELVPCGCGATRSTLPLPRGAMEILSVNARDTIVDADQYKLFGNLLRFTSGFYYSAVEVVYWAGYGETAADVPDAIKEGILEYATTLYEDRTGARTPGGVANAAAIKTVPFGVRDVWRGERLPAY